VNRSTAQVTEEDRRRGTTYRSSTPTPTPPISEKV